MEHGEAAVESYCLVAQDWSGVVEGYCCYVQDGEQGWSDALDWSDVLGLLSERQRY
jgi:hypothetical protein